jgi:hypothetical protein
MQRVAASLLAAPTARDRRPVASEDRPLLAADERILVGLRTIPRSLSIIAAAS